MIGEYFGINIKNIKNKIMDRYFKNNFNKLPIDQNEELLKKEDVLEKKKKVIDKAESLKFDEVNMYMENFSELINKIEEEMTTLEISESDNTRTIRERVINKNMTNFIKFKLWADLKLYASGTLYLTDQKLIFDFGGFIVNNLLNPETIIVDLEDIKGYKKVGVGATGGLLIKTNNGKKYHFGLTLDTRDEWIRDLSKVKKGSFTKLA